MARNIEIVGLNDLQRKLALIANAYEQDQFAKVLDGAAAIMRDNARRAAPIKAQPTMINGHMVPPGNLRRAIQSGVYKRASFGLKSAWVWVNQRIAPHLHLVEKGTKPHVIFPGAGKGRGTKQFMKIPGGGHPFKVAHHPGAKGRPFWKAAVASSTQAVIDHITKGAKAVLDAAVIRTGGTP